MNSTDNPVGEFNRCNLYDLSQERTVAHHGVGEIFFSRIATAADLTGACNFMDFTTMPPGTTIGQHRHQLDEEEFYLILSGKGKMHQNGDEFEVGPGDLIRNPPGGTHALDNIGEGDLQMFVFEVRVV